jgi:hypothetical protein
MDDVEANARKIAELNDQLRTTFKGGMIYTTAGVNALADDLRLRVFEEINGFNDFKPDNDPYGEHDYGRVEVDGIEFLWKIDYYEPTLTHHSENPADPTITARVLTIMLAGEY